ncbi:MAG: branched-chain amino acid ABC transporter permease [Desulfurococcales archaeon]|nr:branched-chain amino acid ABC transporter permease [Desulfurococcales archaeon]
MRYIKLYLAFLFTLILPYLTDLMGYRVITPVLAYSWIMSIYALSFALLLGQLGLLSFGHAFFLGFGAYITVYGLIWLGLPYSVAIIISILAGALLGLIMAIIVSRAFEGIPFAFITLTVQLIVYFLYRKKELAWLSGGEQGLVAYIPPSLKSVWLGIGVFSLIAIVSLIIIAISIADYKRKKLSIKEFMANLVLIPIFLFLMYEWVIELANKPPAFRAMPSLHMISLIILVGVYLFLDRLIKSPLGTIWRAIRDNEIRASTIGYNPFKYKTMALIISGAIAALAGALNVPYALNINPDRVFSPMVSVYALMYAIIGGVYPLLGPILGSLLVVGLEILLTPYVGGYSLIIVGTIFVIVMIASPEGIIGIIQRFKYKTKK